MTSVLITPESMLDGIGPYVAMLKEAGFEVRYPKDPQFARGLLSDEETIEELKGVTATLAGGEVYTNRVLEALPELRVIARSGVGFDRVDMAAATQRGVVVTITPTANHEAVAEHALALLFAVTKFIIPHDREVRAGGWARRSMDPVRGQTLGIVGLGRIGRSMAVRSAALGMKVIAAEKFPDQQFIKQHGIELLDLDTLLGRADFVTIHCPLNDETRGLFDKATFAKMKPDSVLINTARGPIVVEADLLETPTSGHLRAAALDVFKKEPTSADNPLFKLDNIVVSPHLAGNDTRSLEDMGIEAADCIIKLSQGQWPDAAVVNGELKGRWKW